MSTTHKMIRICMRPAIIEVGFVIAFCVRERVIHIPIHMSVPMCKAFLRKDLGNMAMSEQHTYAHRRA